MSKTNNKEDWMQKRWRPAMGWMYMTVCIFDFIIFPILFTVVQFWEVEAVNDAFRQWEPLTLIGGGLFHLAMGAVLGISSWSRGQEKIAGVASNTSNSHLALPDNSNLQSNVSFNFNSNQDSSFVDSYVQPASDYKGRKIVPTPVFPER